MANETQITIVGNLTADPEMRDAGGAQVASFSVASTPRTFDRQTNEWKDGEATFWRVSAWRNLGEHCGATLHKGNRVVVLGTVRQRSYQDREGNARTSLEIEAIEVGAALQFATAIINRSSQGGGQQQGQQQPPQQGYPGAQQQGYPGAQQQMPPQGYPQQQPQGYPPQQQMPPQGYPPQGQQPPQQYPPQQQMPPQGQPPQQPPAQQQGQFPGQFQQPGAQYQGETPF
jgi:single-strand DNA-binding protein